jgi:hypothetical protein
MVTLRAVTLGALVVIGAGCTAAPSKDDSGPRYTTAQAAAVPCEDAQLLMLGEAGRLSTYLDELASSSWDADAYVVKASSDPMAEAWRSEIAALRDRADRCGGAL